MNARTKMFKNHLKLKTTNFYKPRKHWLSHQQKLKRDYDRLNLD